MIYSFFNFGLKNRSFRLPHQRPSSSNRILQFRTGLKSDWISKKNTIASYMNQRWDRTRITRVDSSRIMRFSFRPATGAGVKNLWKTGPGIRVTFPFRQKQEPVRSFLW